jgi:phosphate transport system protein
MPKHLERQMENLAQSLVSLCKKVEEAIEQSLFAVKELDQELAQKIIARDNEIDLAEVELEENCLKILALYQPVAVDLRKVVTALKVNNDLERMGDLGCNIARRANYLAAQKKFEVPVDFKQLVKKTKSMVEEAIKALIYQDTVMAIQVCKTDDEVDELNAKMYHVIFDLIAKNPEDLEIFIQYLFISKNLERIADYATNIAEDVIYMMEGNIVRHKANRETP